MQDYPNWLFQGFLFTQVLKGQPLPGYQPTLLPVPNLISTWMIGLLGLLFSPEISGKIFLSLTVILLSTGPVFLINSLSKRPPGPLALLPLFLVLGYPFYHGLINYLFGIGILSWALGYLANRSEYSGRLSWRLLGFFSFLLYFSHFMAYFIWVLFALSYILLRKEKNIGKLNVFAVFSPLALFLVYLLGRSSTPHPLYETSFAGFIKSKAATLGAHLSLVHSFYPLTDRSAIGRPWLITNAVAVLFLAFPAAAGLALAIRQRYDRPWLFCSLMALAVLYMVLPNRTTGIMNMPERLLFPGLWIAWASGQHCFSDIFPRRGNRVGYALLIILMSAHLTFLYAVSYPVAGKAASIDREIASLKACDHCYIIQEQNFDYQGQHRRDFLPPRLVPLHSPLSMIAYYRFIEKKTPAPVFPTGSFPGNSGLDTLDSVSKLRSMGNGPDELLIMGEPSGGLFLARILSRNYELAANGNSFVLLRKNLVVLPEAKDSTWTKKR